MIELLKISTSRNIREIITNAETPARPVVSIFLFGTGSISGSPTSVCLKFAKEDGQIRKILEDIDVPEEQFLGRN